MMKISVFKITGWIVLTAVVAGLIAFVFPAQATAAPLLQGETPPPTQNPGQTQNQRKAILEIAYQREMRFLEHINGDLGRIGKISDRVDILIGKLQERGIDPAPVQAALAEFIQQANSAAAPRDEAAAILAAHNGFNPQGKVTNVQEAAQTVRSAGVLLRDAHRTFHEALHTLRVTIRDLVGQYLPKPAATPSNPL